MAKSLLAEKRTHMNTSALRNLRHSGRIPGIVFGRNKSNEMIHISAIEFQRWLRQDGSGIIQLELEGNMQLPVLLEDLQRHPVTQDVIHIDFQHVQSNESVRTKVAVKFLGTAVGTKSGGVVQIHKEFIEVETLPQHLPNVIELDISGMDIGESLYIRDVGFAPEVTVLSGANDFLVSVAKP